MAFSRKQMITIWLGFAVMGALLIRPPWFWDGYPSEISSRQFGAGYGWIWDAPPAPAKSGWTPVIWWGRLLDQWGVVAVGMVLLLFLREARQRGGSLEHGFRSPWAQEPANAAAARVESVP